MYSKSAAAYDSAMETLVSDDTVKKYPKYIDHLESSYFHRREKWGMYVRIEAQLPTNLCNTNNFIESSFRVLKENVLNRTKVLLCYYYMQSLAWD